jgi:hypothetical protein
MGKKTRLISPNYLWKLCYREILKEKKKEKKRRGRNDPNIECTYE